MRIINFITARKFQVIFAAIIVLTIFLRTFNVGDWMHYELDQARDFRIIHAAITYGPGELPLQGPKAAGNVLIADDTGALTDKTTLRLGPLFYYIEYLSALIFGATPLGAITLIVILSILTVPLLYLFVRRFFDVPLALGLSAIAASGLFFVTYSRFGWNPNLMPLFMLLFAVSLLRATDINGTLSIGRYNFSRGWWLVIAAIALAFVGHMHFLAFMAAPVVGVIYLIWSYKSLIGDKALPLRFYFGAIIIFFFLQTPLIINDVKTNGENTKAFIASLTQKTQDENPKSLLEKVVRNTGNHAKYYWLIATGDQRAELPVLKGRDIQCDHMCRAGLARGGVALLAMFAGVMAWFMLYRSEKNESKRQFLRMVMIWMSVVYALYTPLAYDMAPRFFLLNAPVALIFMGFIVHAGFIRGKKHDKILGWAIIALAIVSNTMFVVQDFSQRAQAATNEELRIDTDRVMKEKTRMGLGQMENIMGAIIAIHLENGEPVWLHAQPEFKRAFWERLDTAGIPRFGAPKDLSRAYAQGNYFIIIRTQSDQDSFLQSALKNANFIQKQSYGTLTLYQLSPKKHVIIQGSPELHERRINPRFSSNAQVRYLWRQIFESDEQDDVEMIIQAPAIQ